MIEETLTGNETSATTVASSALSTITVFGFDQSGKGGSISLVELAPGGTEYVHGHITGSQAMATPEGNTYSFKANNIVGNVNVFFGP